MISLLTLLTAFPTVIFTVPLAFVLLYWVFVIVGAADIELFEPDAAMDGLAEGALDGALDGAMDGALDGAMDGALDGAMDGAFDGVADGAMDGLADGALDGVADSAMDGAADNMLDGVAEAAEASSSFALKIAALLRIGKVPVSITGSLLLFYAWTVSLLTSYSLQGAIPVSWVVVFQVGLFLLACAVALALTTLTTKPLEGVFTVHKAPLRREFIGHECVIGTGRVDQRFGQAELADRGAGMLLQVRCDRANQLRKGDRALIVHFDSTREAFIVEPMTERLLTDRQAVS